MLQIAFSSVSLALKHYIDDMKSGEYSFHHGMIEKAEGSLPNDPDSYRLRDHMAVTVGKLVSS